MKNNNKKLAMILFVLSTTLVLGSSIDVYANDSTGVRGTTGDGDLEGCLNGSAGDQICNTTAEWSGQNISHDAMYFEDNSIPIRVNITDLDTTPGLVQKLIIDWDITKSQGGIAKHTFDYITSFDTTDHPHPCLLAESTPRCDDFVTVTIPIPPPTVNTTVETADGSNQPIDSFTSLPANKKLFHMFAPPGSELEILHIDYVTEGDPTGQESNTETNVIFVEFTTNSTDVIAAYGAHIASPDDWVNTASDVNGSPYRTGCVEIKDSGGCNSSINISSNVIVSVVDPTVTIVKEVITLDGGNEGVDDFGLFVGTSGSVPSGTTVSILPDTDTSIGETGLTGYTRISGFAAGSSPECADTVNLLVNTNITCIIENDDEPASVTLNVSVLGGGNDVFTPTLDGVNVVSGDLNVIGSNDPQPVDVAEDTSAYNVVITGDPECPVSLGGDITADEGEALTCNITL
ncbi:MAG TPA: hypothetical protein VMW74_07615, partial [Nitrosopumilaceae archaeon]|nr:hypothetical protein [Nitrosopumilaceae archaeon]